MATQFSAGVIVRDPEERAAGIFVADEKEASEIAKPAVSMLARRGTGSGVGDSDFADIFALVMAIIGFISIHAMRRLEIRASRQSRLGLDFTENSGENEATTHPSSGRVGDSLNDVPGGGI